MSLIFFDTEFTGLQKDTNLISLGLVTDDNKELYLEIDNLDIEHMDNWIKENVLKNTVVYGDLRVEDITEEKNYYRGDKFFIRDRLNDFLSQYNDVQFVSDVCHYDFVLLIDLFGSAFDLPDNVNPSCHDINQDIAHMFNISEREAFDKSREDLVKEDIENIKFKHNSLYDAKVIKRIYEIIH